MITMILALCLMCVYPLLYVRFFFSLVSSAFFVTKFFLLVRELECERDTNAPKHTHTHTRRESEREKRERARDSFLFFFLSLYPSADASTKKRFILKTESALARTFLPA